MKKIDRIEEVRKYFRYKKEFMASVLGVTPQTYSYWVSGKRKPLPIYEKFANMMIHSDDMQKRLGMLDEE